MTMPAGKYYIGDLCYVMHPEWDEFCSITIKGRECLDGEFTLADGRRFATYGTMYGDGSYPCSNGAELGVDAGLIGCIRVEDITDKEGLERMMELGTVVEFDREFSTSEREGTIRFGHITVETGFEEEEEYAGYSDSDEDDEDN